MAKGKIASIVYDMAKPIVEEFGFDLVDVEFKKEGPTRILCVIIDKAGGITVEDTHVVATRLNPLLDEKDDLIEGSYRFQVSSPGLDRPLKTESDFKRYKGTRIEVRLYTKIGDNKSFEGILENYDNGDITITDDEGKSLTFEKDNVSIVKRVIVF